MRLLTALLFSTLALQASGRAQVLPAAEFAARDGRPGPGKSWKLSDTQGRALAHRVNSIAAKTPLVVDYDHQTITASQTGAKAPAAGWITQVEWLDGQGLFAQVDWTTAAKGYIQGKEYRYFSPVIEFDDDTGEVTNVLMGALVNFPGILGMQAVESALAARFSSTNHTPQTPNRETEDMNLLAQLLAKLGLPADTAEAAALSSVVEIKAAADAAKNRPVVPAALAGALGVAPAADEAAALAALTTLKTAATAASTTAAGLSGAAIEQITALQGQVTALQTAASDAQINALADQAIAAGKFVPAFRAELLKIGKGSLASLSSMVAAAPVIPGLAGQSAAAAEAAAGTAGAAANAAALSGEQALQVAANMGIKPAAWMAGLKAAA